MNEIILILILMFYVSALTGFVLACFSLSLHDRLGANLWILVMIFGIFVLSWIQLAI